MVVGSRMREELSQKLSRESKSDSGTRDDDNCSFPPSVTCESCTRWSSPARAGYSSSRSDVWLHVEPWAHFTFYLFTEHRTALLISFRSLSNTLATLCVLAARWCGGLRAAPSAHSVRLGSRLGSQKAPGSGLAPSPTLTGPSGGIHDGMVPTLPPRAEPLQRDRCALSVTKKHQTEDSRSPQTPN